jgi:hypothetical protein
MGMKLDSVGRNQLFTEDIDLSKILTALPAENIFVFRGTISKEAFQGGEGNMDAALDFHLHYIKKDLKDEIKKRGYCQGEPSGNVHILIVVGEGMSYSPREP